MTDEERAAYQRLIDATLVLTAAARSADEAVQGLMRVFEGVGDALPKPPPVEQPEPLQPVDTSSIRSLLTALFSVTEVRRLANSHAPSLTVGVDWRGPSAEVVFNFTHAIKRHGLINAAFFDAVVNERPFREAEIRKVQADYTAGGSAFA